ncbi:MAG: hypothetical protein ACYTF0_05435, partial [Planctomycetota bacterium]
MRIRPTIQGWAALAIAAAAGLASPWFDSAATTIIPCVLIALAWGAWHLRRDLPRVAVRWHCPHATTIGTSTTLEVDLTLGRGHGHPPLSLSSFDPHTATWRFLADLPGLDEQRPSRIRWQTTFHRRGAVRLEPIHLASEAAF